MVALAVVAVGPASAKIFARIETHTGPGLCLGTRFDEDRNAAFLLQQTCLVAGGVHRWDIISAKDGRAGDVFIQSLSDTSA